MAMANTGKCPSCEKIIQKVKVEELNISDGLQTLSTVFPEMVRMVSLESLRTLPVEALRAMFVGTFPELEVFLRKP